MAEPPKYTRIWIGQDDGTFQPIEGVKAVAEPDFIRCVPTPAKEGLHYVPDWWGLTNFG